jgi:uncharacterized protein
MTSEPATAHPLTRSLKKKLWVILTRGVADQEKIRAVVPDHLRHQVTLEKQGVLFGAGPLTDEAGNHTGTGLIIIRAANATEARRIADSDPMHAAGVRTYELCQWSMNEGRLQVSFDISDASVRFE